MEINRPIVLSIAGFDPSAGAGILADIKTFEQYNVYGLGISTAQTLQTETDFISIKWEPENDILKALDTMLSHYNVMAVKIGITENIIVLDKIVSFIHTKNKAIKIVADTVLKSSSGFDFWNEIINEQPLFELLSKVYLLTPNYNEVLQLMPSANAKLSAEKLSAYCNVLLKGGHNSDEVAVDYLYLPNKIEKMESNSSNTYAKHGSGCVLSAAITANLALGLDLISGCKNAKKYIEQFLSSTPALLGYHHV